ncbi:MAG: hypothetical protein AB7I30_19940 [Isosphaeraceae bacterium]
MTASESTPGLSEVDAAVREVLAPMLRSWRFRGPDVETFTERLLSVRVVESLGDAVKFVRVAPGTVVTPLARDFLKRQGIQIQYVSANEVGQRGKVGDWGFLVDARGGRMEALRNHWLSEAEPWSELVGSSPDSADWVAESPDRGALVLTEEAAMLVYQACQVPGVRAAQAIDAETAARAVRSIGANLLAVEPAGKPIALIRQIGAAFRRGGAPIAPPWIHGREGLRS